MTLKIFSTLLTLFLISIPIFVSAQQARNDGGTGIVYDCSVADPTRPPGECDFNDVIAAIKHALDVGTTIALEFSVVVIAWAGAKYMISGDKPNERREANQMLRKVAIGIFFILAAWLIVTLVLNGLQVNNNVKQYFG